MHWSYCSLALSHWYYGCSDVRNVHNWHLKINFQSCFSDGYLQYFLRWYPQVNAMGLTDGKSTLVQAMAWCRQATSHYLSQCWPRSMAPLGHNELTSVKEATVVVKYGLPFSTIRVTGMADWAHWTRRNKLGWNLNRNTNDFFQENAF